MQNVTFIDGRIVTRVHHDARRPSQSVQTETFGTDGDDVSVWELVDKILQFIPNRSNHLDLIVDGASAVSALVMRSTIPWKMVVPLANTTLSHRSLRVSTSHFMTFWKVVDSVGLLVNETWLVQHISALETSSADRDDVRRQWTSILAE